MVREFISQLPPDKLSPFAKLPYQVREDAAMDELVESVRTYGILSPLLARPKGEGYELVSGHRRRLAAQKLGLSTVTVLVREMTDDEVVILMVDDGRIAFSPAVKLPYLTRDEQAELWDLIGREDATPSLSQALRMKQLSRAAKLTTEVLYAILTEEKPNPERAGSHQNRVAAEVFPAQLLCAADGAGDHQAAGNHHTPDGGSTGHRRGLEGPGSNGVGRCDEQHQKRRT